jgi:cysteine desulfurase family protein (TIGR01976 family)
MAAVTDSPRFDVVALRARFSALQGGAAHFDGPGGTQTPDVVADAIGRALTSPLSNRGSTTLAERNADDIVTGARAAIGDLLGADPGGVVFGRSMTALTFELSRAMAKGWGPGDEVVVSRLDHDANVRPWVIAAEAVGATVRWVDFEPETGELAVEQVGSVLSERTRLVAVTAASNLIGTMPPISDIGALVHAVGGLLYVDGVHFTPHAVADLVAMGADFYACSPYKFLGPHCGVVAASPERLAALRPDKLLPATDDVPERFELGTLPYELMAGTAAAVDFIADAVPAGSGSRRERILRSMSAIEEYENDLRSTVEKALAEFAGVTFYSRAEHRTPTILITFEGHDVDVISRFLAERNVNAPAGTFYAYEPSLRLGLGESGGLRIGLAPYTNLDDIDRLIDGLRAYFAQA